MRRVRIVPQVHTATALPAAVSNDVEPECLTRTEAQVFERAGVGEDVLIVLNSKAN